MSQLSPLEHHPGHQRGAGGVNPTGWWLVLAAPLSGLITLLLTPVVRRRLLAQGVVDMPGERRSHKTPTPRGGGLAMAAGLLPVLTVLAVLDGDMAVLLVLSATLVLVGWLDDRRNLPVGWRMLVQLVLAVVLLVEVKGIDRISFGSSVLVAPWLWTPLALLGVIWLINLHNFMDGSDGLASCQGAWVGLVFSVIFLHGDWPAAAAASLALAAVCLAFLIWNRPPARLFMGDTGSLLIGGMVAWMLIAAIAGGVVSLWVGLIVNSVFIVDATLTLLMRMVRGERWYTPHRQHAYQRLIAYGWSHGQVLALYLGTNLLLVLPVTILALRYPQQDYWLAGLVVALLALLWTLIQSATNGEQSTA